MFSNHLKTVKKIHGHYYPKYGQRPKNNSDNQETNQHHDNRTVAHYSFVKKILLQNNMMNQQYNIEGK